MAAYGEEDEINSKQKKEDDHKREVALIRAAAQEQQAKNDAVAARAGSLVDTAAQVRLAIYGIDVPGKGSSTDEKKWYCQMMIGRIPGISPSESWEFGRTFEDILNRLECQGCDDTVMGDLDSFIFRINKAISTADPKAASGALTGVGALITSDRRETLNQRVTQSTLGQNSPGVVESLKRMFGGTPK
jgi:hypothetical protein